MDPARPRPRLGAECAFYTSAAQTRALYAGEAGEGGLGNTLFSASSLFRRITANGPLNETVLYSSGLSWAHNIRGWAGGTARSPQVQKEPDNKSTIGHFHHGSTAAREKSNKKNVAIFRLMAVNTIKSLQRGSTPN